MPTPRAPPPRRVCVVLHDVAPARWAGCQRVLTDVAEVAQRLDIPVPVTLLVVPQLHGDPTMPESFRRWLRRRLQNGHELALHGLTHRDDAPAPRGCLARVQRRLYTAGEGEFAALPAAEAARRLRAGRDWASRQGLPMQGFVPPAWLLNAEAWAAVTLAGFDYTCTWMRIVALPEGSALRAPSLVFSTRSRWRRVLSTIFVRALAGLLWRSPVLRLELHPTDADHPGVRRCWMRVLEAALRQREPVRLGQVADALRGAGSDRRAQRA